MRSETPSHRIKAPARPKATFAVDLRLLIRWAAGNKKQVAAEACHFQIISPLMADQYWDVAFSASMVWTLGSWSLPAENNIKYLARRGKILLNIFFHPFLSVSFLVYLCLL
jgi:hypothetical protein